jgi:hypothetical protein
MSTETTQDLAAKSGLAVTEVTRGRKRPDKSKQAPYFDYVTSVDVDIEICPDDLHEQGWHHKNECPAGGLGVPLTAPASLALGWTTTVAALESLHRQAHGDGSIALCRSEPCASLSLEQLRGAA